MLVRVKGQRSMSLLKMRDLKLSDTDLDFLVETASPEVRDKYRLKQIIREDHDFRGTFIGDEDANQYLTRPSYREPWVLPEISDL